MTAPPFGFMPLPSICKYPIAGKIVLFPSLFRLQLTVIAKWVTVVDDVIETATMLIQIHSALELGIILVVRVELGYLHYAARCCTFSRPIYYRIRWPPERPPLIVGSYTELFTGSCWEFLHLLAIFNWPLSTNDAGFDWWYLFTSAMRCVLARLYHQSRLCSPGYAIEAITATIDWIKENGFSLIKAGVNPENTLSKKLLIRIGFNFSSIEDGWAYLCSGFNKRRIISRRKSRWGHFRRTSTCIRQCHLPFPVNGLAFNFQSTSHFFYWNISLL